MSMLYVAIADALALLAVCSVLYISILYISILLVYLAVAVEL